MAGVEEAGRAFDATWDASFAVFFFRAFLVGSDTEIVAAGVAGRDFPLCDGCIGAAGGSIGVSCPEGGA